jgi:hypothetical protein
MGIFLDFFLLICPIQPMMQYKVSLIGSVWSPMDGPLIKLWKVNPNGSPKLPTKVPSPIPYHLIWGNDAF